MITFPIAKINLGLNVVSRRADGYHNLETVFYPVPIKDALEIYPMDDAFPSPTACDLKVTNISIEGDEQRNLVVVAYNMLAERYPLPRIHAHLHKSIPTQAGMGGGSSDCAYMIRLLNESFKLGMSQEEMISHAALLGADCPFFILGRPAYAEGIGEQLHPIDLDLGGWHIVVVRPDIPVPTKDAFSLVTPQQPGRKLPRYSDAARGDMARHARQRLRAQCVHVAPRNRPDKGAAIRPRSRVCRNVGFGQQCVRAVPQSDKACGAFQGHVHVRDTTVRTECITYILKIVNMYVLFREKRISFFSK